MPLPRTRSTLTALSVASTLCLLLACTGFLHGFTLAGVQGRMLDTDTREGARRLALEADYDPAVRVLVDQWGEPRFLLVEDRSRLWLFYVDPDYTVELVRGISPESEVRVIQGIPARFREDIEPPAPIVADEPLPDESLVPGPGELPEP